MSKSVRSFFLLRHPKTIQHARHGSVSATVSDWITDKAYIGGKWVKTSEAPFDVLNPTDGKSIGKAPNCGPKDINQAIEAAKSSFQSWKMTSAKQRSAIIRKMFEIQMAHQKDLAQMISIEMGKPLVEAMGEIVYGASFFEWFSEEARRIKGEILQSPFPDKMIMYTREPAGPAAIIVPVGHDRVLVLL